MKMPSTDTQRAFLAGVAATLLVLSLVLLVYPALRLQPEIRVAGALRSIKGKWFAIDDATHTPVNIDKITVTDGGSIVVYFAFEAQKIHTFHVSPDERFANRGYFVGAAVSKKFAKITIYQREDGIIKKVPAYLIDCNLCNFWVYGLFS